MSLVLFLKIRSNDASEKLGIQLNECENIAGTWSILHKYLTQSSLSLEEAVPVIILLT